MSIHTLIFLDQLKVKFQASLVEILLQHRVDQQLIMKTRLLHFPEGTQGHQVFLTETLLLSCPLNLSLHPLACPLACPRVCRVEMPPHTDHLQNLTIWHLAFWEEINLLTGLPRLKCKVQSLHFHPGILLPIDHPLSLKSWAPQAYLAEILHLEVQNLRHNL